MLCAPRTRSWLRAERGGGDTAPRGDSASGAATRRARLRAGGAEWKPDGALRAEGLQLIKTEGDAE